MKKRCTKCGQEKLLMAFYTRPDRLGHYRSQCRRCINARNKVWRDNNLERARTLTRQHQRMRWRTQPEILKAIRRKSKYGLTEKAFQDLIKNQQGCCAICRKPCNMWNVDHDHVTGNVRGLLCSTCNLLLGYAKDDIFLLDRAIQYLGGITV